MHFEFIPIFAQCGKFGIPIRRACLDLKLRFLRRIRHAGLICGTYLLIEVNSGRMHCWIHFPVVWESWIFQGLNISSTPFPRRTKGWQIKINSSLLGRDYVGFIGRNSEYIFTCALTTAAVTSPNQYIHPCALTSTRLFINTARRRTVPAPVYNAGASVSRLMYLRLLAHCQSAQTLKRHHETQLALSHLSHSLSRPRFTFISRHTIACHPIIIPTTLTHPYPHCAPSHLQPPRPPSH